MLDLLEPEEVPFGLVLLAVERPLYRLQKIGYVGEEGNWRVFLQDRGTGRVHTVQAGDLVPEARSRVVAIESLPAEEGWPLRGEAKGPGLQVTLRDLDRQERLVLGREPLRLGELHARVATAQTEGSFLLRTGERIETGETIFALRDLKEFPARATFERAGSGYPEVRTLEPSLEQLPEVDPP